MEKQDFERCFASLGNINDLIVRLAGNAHIAQRVLADTAIERDYNKRSMCIDDSEIVDALNEIAHIRLDMQNCRDWLELLGQLH